MKAFHFLFCLLATFGLFSCSQDEVFIEGTPSKGLTAEIPDYLFESQTRVSISNDLSTFTWSDGDQIGLYYQKGTSAVSAVFTTLKGGTNSSVFTNDAFSLKPNSTYYAFYPYNSSATVENYPVDFTGQVQSGNGGTSHIGARNYMAATVQTDNSGGAIIDFKNLASVIQVVFPVEKDATFTSLSISTDTEAFITRGNADMKTGVITATEKSREVTLSLGSGITLSAGSQLTANLLVAPVDLSGKELTFTLNSNNGESQFSTVGKTLSAGKAYRFSGESLDEIPYLTFSADASQTLTMSKAVETLEYSVNGGSWQELGTKTVTFGAVNGDLRLRGKSSMGTANNVIDYSYISFGNNTDVCCMGDIRTLVDYDYYETASTENARFSHFFKDCTCLTTSPELPATTLADNCYFSMFYGCTGLTTAPELPATTLAEYCYADMFDRCASLTTAPKLLATTLTVGCYASMFCYCTNLTATPELPATTLADGCYGCMFLGCTSLTTAPKLPATSLADGCYSGMFSYCTSLTMVPELPASTLTNNCYSQMFSECTSLSVAPHIHATTLADNCCRSMFYRTGINDMPAHFQNTELIKTWINRNVGLQGLFAGLPVTDEYLKTILPINVSGKYYLPATTLTDDCYSEMFYGCTSLATAPELPATILAEYCYSGMFSQCTGLTNAPELPATTLKKGCYLSMFNGCSSLSKAPKLSSTTLDVVCYAQMFVDCTNLTTAPELPAINLADGCYSHMFERCTGLTSAPKLPATRLVKDCYSAMFQGCTSLTTAPELLATKLVDYCYFWMFYGCSNLNSIKMMATDISAERCLLSWTDGVSSTGTFVKNASATWSNEGVVPSGWNVQYESGNSNGNGTGTITPGNEHEG